MKRDLRLVCCEEEDREIILRIQEFRRFELRNPTSQQPKSFYERWGYDWREKYFDHLQVGSY